MNPDQPSREQIEVRITALLLGELPPDEAQLLRYTMAQDPALQKLHDELELAMGLVREAAKHPAEEVAGNAAEKSAPLKLSAERRRILLAHFRTPQGKAGPLFWLRRIKLPTARVVVAGAVIIIALMLVAVISIPNFVVSRATSPASSVINNLRQIDAAKQEWALEHKKSGNDIPTSSDLTPYLKGVKPVMGETYVLGKVSEPVAADVDAGWAKRQLGERAASLALGKSSQQVRVSLDEFIPPVADRAVASTAPTLDQFGNAVKPTATAAPEPPLVSPPAPAAAPIALPPAQLESGQLADNGSAGAPMTATTVNQSVAVGGFMPAPTPPADSSGQPPVVMEPGAAEPVALAMNDQSSKKKEGPVYSTEPVGYVNTDLSRGVKVPTVAMDSENSSQTRNAAKDENLGVLKGSANGFHAGGGGGGAGGGRDGGAVALLPGGPPQTTGIGGSLAWNDSSVNGLRAQNQPGAVQSAPAGGYGGAGVYRNLFSASFAKPGNPGGVTESEVHLTAPTPTMDSLTLGGIPQDRIERQREYNKQAVQLQELKSIAKTDKAKLADDLPQLVQDSELNSLLIERRQVRQNLATLTNDSAISSPTVARAQSEVDELNQKINDRVDGIMEGLEAQVAVRKAALDAMSVSTNENDTRLTLANEARLAKEAPTAVVSPNGEEIMQPGLIDFEGAELSQVLDIYAKLVNRTLLRGPLPQAQIVFKQPTPMTKTEAIEALRSVLALNGVALVNVGDRFVKAVPIDQKVASSGALDMQKVQDAPLRKPAPDTPVPQPEILTSSNAFSTFSLNVSDVSFKLAEASLENGKLPDTASIRSEEFINAFDYRDPEAGPGQPMAFTSERARYPFAQNRELLRFAVKTAAAGRQAGRALNLVLLLDNSGSMERADRVAIVREALRVLATQLQPQDTVSVVTFARTARLWADGVRGAQAGETLDRVGGITPEGGTNLEEAMRLAYETAHRHYLAGGMNRVVLLTDGAANLGNVAPGALKQTVDAQRRQGIALDCFGIGWEDYNDDLLELLSSNGGGRYAFLNSPEEAGKDFAAKLAGALQIAAADVKVQVEFNPQRVISYRQIGYAKHQLTKEQFRDNTVAAGEIAAQEAGNALYTIEANPNGDGPVATVHVRYRIPGTDDYREHSWEVAYLGTAPALARSSPAMRLAATAGAFSEWLAASPYAQEVTLDELLKQLSGVPEVYGADDRPKQLETMIREAKSLEGK